VDPRRTELASMAHEHLQLRPGSNVPLLNSLAAVLVEEGLVNRFFVDQRTEGYDQLAQFLKAFRPEDMEALTGVPAARVRRAARMYAHAARPMQVHGLGMTEHYQGAEGVRLLCNLALLVGAIGREGTGVNPLRGQNNVQGAADMGCQPDLLPGYQSPKNPGVRALFERVWDRPLPTVDGRTRAPDVRGRGELKGFLHSRRERRPDRPRRQERRGVDGARFRRPGNLPLGDCAARASSSSRARAFSRRTGRSRTANAASSACARRSSRRGNAPAPTGASCSTSCPRPAIPRAWL
jgi:hypothetical protein